MPAAYLYHPTLYYLIVISISLVLCPIAAYVSHHKRLEKYTFPLILFGLCVPCITTLAMIYASPNDILIQDFWARVLLFKFSSDFLMVILFLMPCTVLLATTISLFFGYSSDQFSIANELSVKKGWAILGIIIPLLLAPMIEELGWRGYGIDSLRAYFNLFSTSLLFGFLWSLWHLPAFFVKDYYQNQLLKLGIIYVINFFVSVFAGALLMNWVYYKTGRSIPAVILFHFILNLFSILWKTDQFTKCIVTVILCVIAVFVIVYDSNYFFNADFL